MFWSWFVFDKTLLNTHKVFKEVYAIIIIIIVISKGGRVVYAIKTAAHSGSRFIWFGPNNIWISIDSFDLNF